MYFLLFPTCIPVLGSKNCAIYSLELECIDIIPREVYYLIKQLESHSVEEMVCTHGNVVKDWIAYLLNHNVGFYTETPACFPPMELLYESPSIIRRAQIEVSSESSYSIQNIAHSLNTMLCKHIEIRLRGNSSEQIEDILKALQYTCIRSITLYIEDLTCTEKCFEQYIQQHPKVHSAYVFSRIESRKQNIFFRNESYLELTEKQWPIDRMIINHRFFTESHNFNTFYNSKLAISHTGEIKNDLSLAESYGVYSPETITGIVSDPFFRRFWGINVDKISEIREDSRRYAMYPAREIFIEGEEFHINV